MMWTASHVELRGRGHEKTGKPCQDKTAIRELGPVMVGVLADGAGSASLSHFGAEGIAEAVSEELAENFDTYFGETAERVRGDLESCITETLERLSHQYQCEKSDLASTLLVTAVSGDRYILIHVGDGVIGYLKNNEIHLASAPSNGEFANQTEFTTSPMLRKCIRLFHGEDRTIQGFVLMSDGTEHSLYSKQTQSFSSALPKLLGMTATMRDFVMEEILEDNFRKTVLAQTQDDCSILLMAKGQLNTFSVMSKKEKAEVMGIKKSDVRDMVAVLGRANAMSLQEIGNIFYLHGMNERLIGMLDMMEKRGLIEKVNKKYRSRIRG